MPSNWLGQVLNILRFSVCFTVFSWTAVTWMQRKRPHVSCNGHCVYLDADPDADLRPYYNNKCLLYSVGVYPVVGLCWHELWANRWTLLVSVWSVPAPGKVLVCGFKCCPSWTEPGPEPKKDGLLLESKPDSQIKNEQMSNTSSAH